MSAIQTDTGNFSLRGELTPMRDGVLFRRVVEEEYRGSVLMPRSRDESLPTCEGRVVSVGPKCKSVRSGDHVIVNRYVVVDVLLNDEPLLIVKSETDVLCTVTGVGPRGFVTERP